MKVSLINLSEKKFLTWPYINNEIRSHIKRKHRLQRLYTKYHVTCEKQYKNCRNLVTRLVREAQNRYFDEKKLEKNTGNRFLPMFSVGIVLEKIQCSLLLMGKLSMMAHGLLETQFQVSHGWSYDSRIFRRIFFKYRWKTGQYNSTW